MSMSKPEETPLPAVLWTTRADARKALGWAPDPPSHPCGPTCACGHTEDRTPDCSCEQPLAYKREGLCLSCGGWALGEYPATNRATLDDIRRILRKE